MRALVVVFLLLSGCGGSPENEASPSSPAEREIHPFALTGTTPVRTGEHMVRQLDRQQADRDRRNADLESLLEPRDR